MEELNNSNLSFKVLEDKIIKPELIPDFLKEFNYNLPYEIPEDKTIQPELTPDFLEFIHKTNINNLRNQRDQLLIESDKYMLVDYPITSENLVLIKNYRQILRDFTQNDYVIPEFPF